MDIFSQLTDDQVALLGCFAALVATGTLMTLSHHLKPNRTKNQQQLRQTASRKATTPRSDRKAA